MSLFGTTNDTNKFQFLPIIGLDVSSLALYSQAKILQRTTSLTPSSRLPDDIFGKAFNAPWEIEDADRSLAGRINEVRDLQKFVDLNAKDVKVAGSDHDSRTLFALYKGLAALRTLAQYAGEKTTSASSLARLDAQFQSGLKEVQNFFSTMETDQIRMLMGDKTTSITSTAALGKDPTGYVGNVAQTGQRDDALAGIVGTETFSIDLTKSGITDNINVDLSNITGTISINSVVDEMNAQISALLLTDEFGDPVLDGDGNTQSKYLSRFSVDMNANYDYSIKLDGVSTETVAMVAGTSSATLYVTGNLKTYDTDKATSGTLTKIAGLVGTGVDDTKTTIQSIDTLATEVADAAAAAEAANGEGDKVAAFEALTGTTVTPETDEDETEPDTTVSTVSENAVYGETTTSSVAVDSEGFVYVVGQTQGDMGNQLNADGTSDIYLTKTDSLGNVVYNRYIGNSTLGGDYDVTVDANNNVIVTGQTNSDLSGTDAITSTDAFVTKFNSGGDEMFTYQLDTIGTTNIHDVTVDANGDIFMAGYTTAAISSTSGYSGGSDAMVLKVSGTTGALLDSTVFGTAGNDKIGGITFSSDGNVLVAAEQDGVAILTKLDATALGTQLYNEVLGTLGAGGSIAGVAVDGGNVYVAGTTSNAAFSSAEGSNLVNGHSGGADGFVISITDDPTTPVMSDTTFLGGTGTDVITDITAQLGTVFVAGRTSGSVNGETTVGTNDAFVVSVDGTTGIIGATRQFGQALGSAGATGIAFAQTGNSVLEKLGLHQGTLQVSETRDITTQTSVRDGDYFYISVNGGAKRKVSISEGETYENIARRINTLSFRNIEAEVISGEGGDTLRIKAINGGEIELFGGDGEKDALGKLGLKPVSLLSEELLFPKDPNPKVLDLDDIGGTFSLGLVSAYHLRDKSAAQYTFGKLEFAITNIQRAYRSLTFDEADLVAFEATLGNVGAPSPYMSSRIANFQDALNRLQASSFSSGGGTVV